MADNGSTTQAPAGPVGTGNYVVKPGDGIESIAYFHGLFWQTVWNDSNNATLKDARKDPNVLLPGDRVFLIAKRRKEVSKQAEQRHRFKRKGVPHVVRVRFGDWKDKPIANMHADVNVDGKLIDATTDADGMLEIPISPGARRAKVRFDNGHEFTIDLGHLDPVTETVGVQQRLRNLGLHSGTLSGQLDPATVTALKQFQASESLDITGEPTQTTRDLLVTRNGS